MIHIQNKINNIVYSIDELKMETNILYIKGWIFSKKSEISDVYFIIEDNKNSYPLSISTGIKRKDVFRAHDYNAYAKKSGFYGRILIENIKTFSVFLCYTKDDKEYKFCIKHFKLKENKFDLGMAGVTVLDELNGEIDLSYFLQGQCHASEVSIEKTANPKIDIIVPVYNGYDYLSKLFNSIDRTALDYRIIVINDSSTDVRVNDFLYLLQKNRSNVVLIENEVNLGFVKSVNKGIEISQNHIALVNTDVELPEGWLERLMLPILRNDKIASSTPFTNCGTICSFPNICEDNSLFLDLCVDEIDKEFEKIQPPYRVLPTGVGFCMGMNKKAIQEIGMLDDESFGKGYGEENDWCQRAIAKGYINVQVENLFVYHKHGGSFQSEDKKRYLKEHEEILKNKHPFYYRDVALFCTLDPNRNIRDFLKTKLILKHKIKQSIVAFDHSLGGGATVYLEKKMREESKKGQAFCIIRFDYVMGNYKLLFYYNENKTTILLKNLENIISSFDFFLTGEIWINELATYPDIYETLNLIANYAITKKVKIKMLVHDFFPVCPTTNLLNFKQEYCKNLDLNVCENCIRKVEGFQLLEFESMSKWRQEWRGFLKKCDEIEVFSKNSKEILEAVYGKIDSIRVHPHEVDYITKLEHEYKTTKTFNIGLLGILTNHKGLQIVEELLWLIEKNKMNVRVKLIGKADKEFKSSCFYETGEYAREEVPRLVLQHDIDVFLIPSIWPETFSYTSEEIIKMNIPIMCFEIGAPAERVKAYKRGFVIKQISANAVIEEINKNNMIQDCFNRTIRDKRILFLVEELTFSSRYRVEHLREQLILQGIASDVLLIDKHLKVNIKQYEALVFYRCSKEYIVRKIIKKAHKCQKKVFYDIDDYIFDYDKIKFLDFLNGDDYKDFEVYSKGIRNTMELCDKFIVSTNNLKKAIAEVFGTERVYINRNVASMEMIMISEKEKKLKEVRKRKKIILGYFSGTKTHDNDFASIEKPLLQIMSEYDNVYLRIGGQLELSEQFKNHHHRIERFPFVSWRKLPELIADVDVNLMPVENTFFHACKSENKWMEAALVSVPTVASWNNELQNAIETGVNGYLCKSESDWYNNVKVLIDNSTLREAISCKAYKKVKQEYTTFSLNREFFEELVGIKNEEIEK